MKKVFLIYILIIFIIILLGWFLYKKFFYENFEQVKPSQQMNYNLKDSVSSDEIDKTLGVIDDNNVGLTSIHKNEYFKVPMYRIPKLIDFKVKNTRIEPFYSKHLIKNNPKLAKNNPKLAKDNWFIQMLSKYPGQQMYYTLKDSEVYLNNPDGSQEKLGLITDAEIGRIFIPDKNVFVDMRQKIAIFGPPAQWTSEWLSKFIDTDKSAKLLKSKLVIISQKLYIINGNIGEYVEIDPSMNKTQRRKIMNDNRIRQRIIADVPYTGHSVGYADDAHIGQLRMTDGKWLDIGDVFTLIAGPGVEKFRYTIVPENFRRLRRREHFRLLKKCKYTYNNLINDEDKETFIITNEDFFRYIQEHYSWGSFWHSVVNVADNVASGVTSVADNVASGVTSVADKLASGVMTAEDWAAHRINDSINFVKDAADHVKKWAEIGFDALEWAANTSLGKLIIGNLIRIGNIIGDTARSVANKVASTAMSTIKSIKENVWDKGLKVAGNAIADVSTQAFNAVKQGIQAGLDFLASFPAMAKKLVDMIMDQLKNASTKIWNIIKKPLFGMANMLLDGVVCEYKVNRTISKIEAIKTIESAMVPKLTLALITGIKELITAASGGILGPLMVVVMPLVEPYIDPHIDDLFDMLFEQDFAITGITTIMDPVVDALSKTGLCDFLDPPSDIDDIIFSTLISNIPKLSTLISPVQPQDDTVSQGSDQVQPQDDTVSQGSDQDDTGSQGSEEYSYKILRIDSPRVLEYYINTMSQMNINDNENFRFDEIESFRFHQFSAESLVDKATKVIKIMIIAKKLYENLPPILKELRSQFESMTDLSILSTKFCKWANNGKLLTGLQALVDKIINKYPSKATYLKPINNILIKLLSAITVVKSIEFIINKLPGIPEEVTDTISKITDIDKNMLSMFNAIGFHIC